MLGLATMAGRSSRTKGPDRLFEYASAPAAEAQRLVEVDVGLVKRRVPLRVHREQVDAHARLPARAVRRQDRRIEREAGVPVERRGDVDTPGELIKTLQLADPVAAPAA